MTTHVAYGAEGNQESEATVLLLIENDRNQELLAGRLRDRFTVKTRADFPFDATELDLCLVDTGSFGTYLDQLHETKDAAEPTFLPYLLLTGDRSPDELDSEIWTLVDEVIQRPVSKSELDARISNLLKRRRLSLELTRQKEQSERRFESLFKSTPDPVVVVTSDGTITEANDAFAEIFGIDHEEVIGRQLTEIELSPAESVERMLLRVNDDSPSTATVEWDLGDDSAMITELNTDVVSGIDGAAERIGIFRDVTHRIEQEQELKRQNERLEEFAETVAHDLRNPLSVARGRLDLAKETGDAEHFTVVEQSHERMEQMIEELLSLAKQGQVVLDPEPMVLTEVIRKAWAQVQTPEASLEVELDSDMRITADEGRVRELFENLFRNAVEHGSTSPSSNTQTDAVEHAGQSVTVTVGPLPARRGFFVEDDGTGIPADDRNKVLEAGYTNSEAGTGFGLSIVQQIVQGHDWTLSVTDGSAGGARFEIADVSFHSS